METVNVVFVSSVDYKLSKSEILRGIVTEKLTTAAQEIFAVVERTVAGYEEEASGLRQEIDRQRRQLEAVLQPRVTLCRIDVENSESWAVLGHAEEEEDEDEQAESAEQPVQSTSLDQEDLGDQITNTRGQSVKMKHGKHGHINLRVCLLEDSQTKVLAKGVEELRCPRELQEDDFLDLLRSTFPQLTGRFDVFTTDATKTLTPLKLKTLTPQEIQRSIKSTGKERSALYIRAKKKDKATNDTRNYKNRPHASSHNSPLGNKINQTDLLSSNSGRQQVETEEDREQLGTSDDFSALPSARSAAENKGDNGDDDGDTETEEDYGDDDRKPDKNDEELRASDTELNSSKTIRKQRAEHSGVKTKRKKRVRSSLKASTDRSVAPLSCKVCQSLRGSMNMLIKHAWSHVDDPERLCGVCGEHPQSVEELRSHLQSHQKTHSCNVCGKSFLSVAGLNSHTTVHTGERPYKCDVCHKTFTSISYLKTHRWKHVEDKPHKCDVCHQSFAFKQQLRIHSRTHTGEKPYSCDVCGKSVSDFRSLAYHKLGHTGEKRYSCQICGKRFLTPRKVKEHEKIHKERHKTYLCDICCKAFPTGSGLKVHLKSHSKKKIMCSECGKGLSSQGALKRHMIIHTGERPYKCSECERSFNSMSTLSSHLKTHSVNKPFVCGVCGKACARKEYLKVHMRTHNGEKPYQCTICNKAFTQSHCLKTHMKSHQGEEQPAVDEVKS